MASLALFLDSETESNGTVPGAESCIIQNPPREPVGSAVRERQSASVRELRGPHFPVLFLAINKRETLAQAGVWASRPALRGLHTAPAPPHTSRSGAFVPQRDPFPDGAAETGPQQEGGGGPCWIISRQKPTSFPLLRTALNPRCVADFGTPRSCALPDLEQVCSPVF